MIVLTSPTFARLYGYDDKLVELRDELTYTDRRIDFELKKHQANRRWFVGKHGQPAYQTRLEALQSQRKKCLLHQDQDGYYTLSGLAGRLAQVFGDEVQNQVQYPESDLLPWAKKPEHSMRPYQEAARDLLLKSLHAGVEHCTGAGKSRTIMELIKALGVQAVIMAPSRSIAGQLYRDFVHHFGPRYIGMFGDGKKQIGKRFTIAIGASLTRVEPGSDEWEFFSKTKILCGDESHLLPAATLEKVCFGVLANAPYRFFFSATQLRNDGLDLLLEGITGPIVHRVTVEECVGMGYLAKPRFSMVQVTSGSGFSSKDANEMTRTHLFYNDSVNRVAANFANRFAAAKKPVVILVDEVEQFAYLQRHLKVPASFAHGTLNAENKKKVPKEHWDVDVDQLVDDFNAGKIPVLVGTACIATGTDLRVTEVCVYLQGGKSEIQVKQAVGRGTRGGSNAFVFNPWTGDKKLECIMVDFDVTNVDTLHRHAEERLAIYDSVFPPTIHLDYRNVE